MTLQNKQRFDGKHYAGVGDVEYLNLLDIARRMFTPDPEFQNMSMLYTPWWNGFVEGPTWKAWWIQNSYGTTYSALPIYDEPYITFLQNSQDLWFDQMGDGKTSSLFKQGSENVFHWIAPDGCLCDAAAPGWVVRKQGDGRVNLHDWGMEFTAAGVLMQAELLLIGHDIAAIEKYLPKLERCAEFLESRRDPKNNLYLSGPAGNLLAPSYGGYRKPDGSYDMGYLTGLSVTTIAALNRLIELEKLVGNNEKVEVYTLRRDLSLAGLKAMETDEGYFIRSLDPDGIKHGVYGNFEHGYFEAPPNHDAIAFRVVDDTQAKKIYDKIVSIPELRPYDFIIANYPSYDDMYEQPEGPGYDKLWSFGAWVNGGHWSTCEARMILAYYRLGQFEDARKSMRQLLTFARRFRLDNPLAKFGSEVTQPNEPINLCYDTIGPAAAFIRGLFEYLYRADSLTLIPHIPPTIEMLQQKDPIRFGKKKLFLSTIGTGPITAVRINGSVWNHFTSESIVLPFDQLPDAAQIQIALGNQTLHEIPSKPVSMSSLNIPSYDESAVHEVLAEPEARIRRFVALLTSEGFSDGYEPAHAVLILKSIAAIVERRELHRKGCLPPLPEPSRTAADQSYIDTANRLYQGFKTLMDSYGESRESHQKRLYDLWMKSERA
ncbi:MAG: hypothetical protein GX629_03485 [Phycisphaerae bacterium]|jgi:hypothetical protein|nr:hypothetical protein [Phycisphaerae bacterium]